MASSRQLYCVLILASFIKKTVEHAFLFIAITDNFSSLGFPKKNPQQFHGIYFFFNFSSLGRGSHGIPLTSSLLQNMFDILPIRLRLPLPASYQTKQICLFWYEYMKFQSDISRYHLGIKIILFCSLRNTGVYCIIYKN